MTDFVQQHPGDAIQLGALLFAVLTYVLTNREQAKRERKLAHRELYTRLELASIDLFRFEADHAQVAAYLDHVTPPTHPKLDHVVRSYLCQQLNLFEMAIAFRQDDVIPDEVFASWVIWFYDTTQVAGFDAYWNELRPNYTANLRSIMDKGLALRAKVADETRRKRELFTHVATLTGCQETLRWLDGVTSPADASPKAASTGSVSDAQVTITWERDATLLDELVAFFVANVTTDYISHGEVLAGRATDFDHWSDQLTAVLRRELGRCFDPALAHEHRLAVLRAHGTLAGLAVLELSGSAPRQTAVLSDLLIADSQRGRGLGQRLLRWLESELATQGVKLILLESGLRNRTAHRFFEQHGFAQSSVVMRKML